MFEDFPSETQEVFSAALTELERRGDRRLDSVHLFLGLFHAPSSIAACTLGIDLTSARAALEELDRSALAAIGIYVARAHMDSPVRTSKSIPWTYAARDLLKRSAEELKRTHSRSLDPRHLLLAMLDSKRPDPTSTLLDHLAIDRTAVRGHLGGLDR